MRAQRVVVSAACCALLPRSVASAQTPADTVAVEERPVLLSQPQLGYRTCLEEAGVHGRAVVRFIVDTSGHVDGASVVIEQSAGRILDSLAIAGSRGLVFRPARSGGSPVRMAVVLPLDFRAGVPAVASSDSGVFSVDCVDREPALKAVVPLTYPETMRSRGLGGEALLEFVVDTNGRADLPSVRLVNATQSDFATAARTAVARAQFRPALLSGTAVRCRVRLPVVFQIARDGKRPPTGERRPDELPPIVVTAYSRLETRWWR